MKIVKMRTSLVLFGAGLALLVLGSACGPAGGGGSTTGAGAAHTQTSCTPSCPSGQACVAGTCEPQSTGGKIEPGGFSSDNGSPDRPWFLLCLKTKPIQTCRGAGVYHIVYFLQRDGLVRLYQNLDVRIAVMIFLQQRQQLIVGNGISVDRYLPALTDDDFHLCRRRNIGRDGGLCFGRRFRSCIS